MTPTQTAIIDYLGNVTKGLFRCTPYIAGRLIELATGNGTAYVIKQRYNANGNFENLQVIQTTDEQIKQVRIKTVKQIPGFYRYQCFDGTGAEVCTLETINPHLFN